MKDLHKSVCKYYAQKSMKKWIASGMKACGTNVEKNEVILMSIFALLTKGHDKQKDCPRYVITVTNKITA